MNNIEKLTEEELRIIINDDELFDEFNLKDMYSVIQESLVIPSCPDCGLHNIKENKQLFYNSRITRCRKCSKEFSKKNTQLRKLR